MGHLVLMKIPGFDVFIRYYGGDVVVYMIEKGKISIFTTENNLTFKKTLYTKAFFCVLNIFLFDPIPFSRPDTPTFTAAIIKVITMISHEVLKWLW